MSVKVFFNNSCNICKMEIDHYKKYSDNSLDWIDITNNDEAPLTSKTQVELLRRLHVIQDGQVIGVQNISNHLVKYSKIQFYTKSSVKSPYLYYFTMRMRLLHILFLKNKHQLK